MTQSERMVNDGKYCTVSAALQQRTHLASLLLQNECQWDATSKQRLLLKDDQLAFGLLSILPAPSTLRLITIHSVH